MPEGEQAAWGYAQALPELAGTQVDSDPLRMQSYNRTAGEGGQLLGAGAQGLNRFASGDFGNSPAVQSAVDAISNTVKPKIQNTMAKAGLGRSGAMLQELQSGMSGALLPLYMQGLQQQQGAAGTLAQLGGGLEGVSAQQAQTIGQSGEQLGTDAISRATDALMRGTLPTTMELGSRDTSRDTNRLQQAFETGALDRDVAGQQAQAEEADVLRRQALTEVFATTLLGGIPSLTTFPSTQTETYQSPSSK